MDEDARKSMDEGNAILLDIFEQLLPVAEGVQVRLMREKGWKSANAEKVAAEYLAAGLAMVRASF